MDVLVQSENKNFSEWCPKLCRIFAKLNPSMPERDTFLLNAVRWSSKDGRHGDPMLHQVCAIKSKKNQNEIRFPKKKIVTSWFEESCGFT